MSVPSRAHASPYPAGASRPPYPLPTAGTAGTPEPGFYDVPVADIPAETDRGAPTGEGAPFAGVRRARAGVPWAVLGVISAGGAIGAVARYGVGRAVGGSATGFPWGTFIVNISGCLLIGVLMVLISDVWPGRRLLRPFLGVGLLGGYTTFSTYIVDIQRLTAGGAVATAVLYLAGTLAGALVAVYSGMMVTHMAVDRARRARAHRAGEVEPDEVRAEDAR